MTHPFRATRRHALRASVLAAAATLLLHACGGGINYGGGTPGTPDVANRYAATLLVSDRAGAAHLDVQLSDPWDFALNGASVLWLTNPGSNRSTVFNASDLALPAVAEKPAFGCCALVLYALGRSALLVVAFGLVDLTLAALFALAYCRTPNSAV